MKLSRTTRSKIVGVSIAVSIMLILLFIEFFTPLIRYSNGKIIFLPDMFFLLILIPIALCFIIGSLLGSYNLFMGKWKEKSGSLFFKTSALLVLYALTLLTCLYLIFICSSRMEISDTEVVKKNIFRRVEVRWCDVKSIEFERTACINNKGGNNPEFHFYLYSGEVIIVNSCGLYNGFDIEREIENKWHDYYTEHI